MQIADIATPALLLDRRKLARNCAAMLARAQQLGVTLRPHLKTAKSAEVAKLATGSPGGSQTGGITVSTVAEARYFAQRGFRDLTYAVGLAAAKLPALVELQRAGARITHLVDSIAAVRAAAEAAKRLDAPLTLLIEIDSGGGRGGVQPAAPAVLALGRAIAGNAPLLSLAGVLTHAGQSYHGRSVKEIAAVAEQERAGVVAAAERLRAAGMRCPVVSAGSTPTVLHARSMQGVTEVRPGVYTLCDLDQVGLGSCEVDDIAVSVLATVIGHNQSAGRILIDAGALAISKDASAQEFLPDVGYGWICPADGSAPLKGLLVDALHQEHGLIASRAGELPWDRFPVGARLRVLPNHACLTVAPYQHYHVVDGGTDVVALWDKATGWH